MSIHAYFKKLSKTTRILSLLGLALVIFVIAVALVICGLWFYGKKAIVKDPAKAMEGARAICDFTVPEGYKISLLAAFSNYKCASMYDLKNRNSIILTLFPSGSGMRTDLAAITSKQTLIPKSKMNYTEVGNKTVTIRGEAVRLSILEGVTAENRRHRDWIGAFGSDNGMVVLSIGGWEENWDEPTFIEFIESIH